MNRGRNGPTLGERGLANEEGPFEGVWCDVLGWLQEDPDASAVALLGRLQEPEPDRISRAYLRAL